MMVLPWAYHTATTVQSDGLVKDIFNGGVTYEGRGHQKDCQLMNLLYLISETVS